MASNASDLRSVPAGGSAIDFYRRVRTTVDWPGIVTILIQCLILALAFGPGAAFLLVVVAMLVTAASLLANTRSQPSVEISEPRGWRNAMANAGLATGLAALSLLVPSPYSQQLFAVAAVASLAASMSDSLSHELGMLFGGKPRLITTWNQVQPGENGAVSLVGIGVGIVSAFGLTMLAFFVGVITSRAALLAGLAACAGNLIDSVLGATAERRGWLSNNGVNFLAVFSSGFLVLLAFLVWGVT